MPKKSEKLISSLKLEQARGAFETAKFYEKQRRWQGAVAYYSEVLNFDRDSSYAAEARERIARLQPKADAAAKKRADADKEWRERRRAAQERPIQLPPSSDSDRKQADAASHRHATDPGLWALPNVRALLLVGLACMLAGCAGYRMGPTNGMTAGSHSVQVNLFANQTREPRLSEPVAQSLRRQLQQDGTFRLATQSDADVIVDGALLTYEREPLSFNPTDIVTTRDYEAKLTARIRAVERGTGRLVIDREVTGHT